MPIVPYMYVVRSVKPSLRSATRPDGGEHACHGTEYMWYFLWFRLQLFCDVRPQGAEDAQPARKNRFPHNFLGVYLPRYIRTDHCDDAEWDLEIDVDLTDKKSEYRWVAWIRIFSRFLLLEADQMKVEKHFH